MKKQKLFSGLGAISAGVVMGLCATPSIGSAEEAHAKATPAPHSDEAKAVAGDKAGDEKAAVAHEKSCSGEKGCSSDMDDDEGGEEEGEGEDEGAEE